jgi:hypothetical protein
MPKGQSSRPARDGTRGGIPAHGGAASAGQQGALPRWGRAGAVALFLFLALMAVQSARLGASALLDQMAQSEFDRWNLAKQSGGVTALDRAEDSLAASLKILSGNPWALEHAGALDLARMRATIDPREALAAAQGAHDRFRQALLQRPTSPFLWANLALSKLYLDQIDDEFFTALRHAGELGPWEPAVQQTTLFVGLATWDRLDSELRRALVHTVERGASRNAGNIYQIVKSYRRLDLVCGIKKYNDLSGLECNRAAEAARGGKGEERNGADDQRR